MGGAPSKGTAADRRLKENQDKPPKEKKKKSKKKSRGK